MISSFHCLSGEIKVARIFPFFVIAKMERGVPTAFNSYIELKSALRSAVTKAAYFIFDRILEEDVIQTIFFSSTHTLNFV